MLDKKSIIKILENRNIVEIEKILSKVSDEEIKESIELFANFFEIDNEFEIKEKIFYRLKKIPDFYEEIEKILDNKKSKNLELWFYRLLFDNQEKFSYYIDKALNSQFEVVIKLAISESCQKKDIDSINIILKKYNEFNTNIKEFIFENFVYIINDIKQIVVDNINSEDDDIKEFSIKLLLKTDSEEYIDKVIQIYNESEKFLTLIIDYLENISSDRATELLIKVLSNEYWGNRKHAAEAIMRSYEKRKKYIKSNFNKFNTEQKYWLIRIFSEKDDFEMLELAFKNYKKYSWSIRALIAFIIGDKLLKDKEYIIDDFVDDENFEVRKNSYIALSQINKEKFANFHLNNKEAKDILNLLNN